MAESTAPNGQRDLRAELAVPADTPLVERISAMIEQSRALAARQTNVVLTMLYWEIGRLIDVEVLRQGRAKYARQIVGSLAPQLAARYGRGFDKSNLHRMIKLSQVFPDRETVGSLAPQLSWTHLTVLLPVRTDEARAFYIEQAVAGRLSAKGLRELIGRQGFERKEIANAQTPGSEMVPADSFRDPYLLDFLGLRGAYDERDLEDAIVHDLQEFLLEVGNGWAFVARQKRLTIEDDDFYLDLLFYSRPLRRLIAVELKVGRFKAAFEGQMKLYLKWLDRYERREDEEAPIGLILCTEASREQVEMLEMHKDGIVSRSIGQRSRPRQNWQPASRRSTELPQSVLPDGNCLWRATVTEVGGCGPPGYRYAAMYEYFTNTSAARPVSSRTPCTAASR